MCEWAIRFLYSMGNPKDLNVICLWSWRMKKMIMVLECKCTYLSIEYVPILHAFCMVVLWTFLNNTL